MKLVYSLIMFMGAANAKMSYIVIVTTIPCSVHAAPARLDSRMAHRRLR